MKMDDMILVSTDDHAIEPVDMFARHTPAGMKEAMPRVVTRNGIDLWVFEDRAVPNLANNAVIGRVPEQMGMEPASYSQMRRSCYDVHARVDDMSANGVLAGLNFPSFPGTAGQMFLKAKDKALAARVIQAWNDWHIDEWCASHPERFIPLAIVPLWDPALAAAEVVRVKNKGCNSITMLPNPIAEGLPNWHGDFWDPLWAACDENDVVVSMHIADASKSVPSGDSAIEAFFACIGVTLYSTAVDLVYSHVPRDFRNIRISLAEGGAGWVPNALERMDLVHKRHRGWSGWEFGGRLPSEVFRQHFLACMIAEDVTAVRNRHAIGLNTLTWETDFPHSEANWPNSPEILWESMQDVPAEEVDLMTHGNALRAYGFDPFRHRPRARCTVGALRAEAAHVDTRLVRMEGIPPRQDAGPVVLRDALAQMMKAYQLHID
ncbi:MAG: amidohydrolase family protein [Gammaproteobacteria bacterium]